VPLNDETQILAKIASVPHWYHRIEIRPGLVTPGINDSPTVLRTLGLPQDCHGLRALDLGTRDGFFAFELARRGADVVAVDYLPRDKTGFAVASELLGIDVPYRHQNLYTLDHDELGTFDIVLFLGVLYHLPDPMAALRLVRRLCRGRLYLETQLLDHATLLPDGSFTSLETLAPQLRDLPLMQFYRAGVLNDDPTNYWAPNAACLRGMLAENNFEVETEHLGGARGIFTCRVVEDSVRAYWTDVASGARLPG